jgi:molybdate/tungstate transport system substrate-binding protein
MSGNVLPQTRAYTLALIALTLSLVSGAAAQTPSCVPPSDQQLIIYRAGSLSGTFKPLIEIFTCQTGIQVKDVASGSVDAGRQITAGGHASDLYAPADYEDIDVFMKPAGYADFNIVFAQGRMVLAYSASSVAEKKLPSIADPNSQPFNPPASIPNATAKWYENLMMPGVKVGGGNPFLDPGAYRTFLMFQLTEAYYKVPNLYNDLLEHLVIPGADPSGGPALGKRFDYQFMYEHGAQAMASKNPDFRYVNVPDEINMSDPAKNDYYREHALIVLPGLDTPSSARSVSVTGTRVAWGITLMKNAPNRENAIKFLQLLLSPTGTAMLKEKGPAPISPALVSPADFRKLPESLRPLVKTMEK